MENDRVMKKLHFLQVAIIDKSKFPCCFGFKTFTCSLKNIRRQHGQILEQLKISEFTLYTFLRIKVKTNRINRNQGS